MNRIGRWRPVLGIALGALLLTTAGSAQTTRLPARPAPAKPAPKFVPKFEALAETPLIMEGLALSNYRSVNRLLKERPKDNETWMFARGQALLIAETGNLLLLRPPRNSGRDTWMKLGMGLRSAAAEVARAAGSRDHARAKQALVGLTAACNRCHTTFRVPVKVAPEGAPARPDA
jgi:hypothetical protein